MLINESSIDCSRITSWHWEFVNLVSRGRQKCQEFPTNKDYPVTMIYLATFDGKLSELLMGFY